MNGHDALCRGYYQRHTDPKDCASCDLIAAVREDDRTKFDTNIGKLNAAYKRGYTDGREDSALEVEDYFKGVPSLAQIHIKTLTRILREE